MMRAIPRPRGLSQATLAATLDKVAKRGYEQHPSPITAGVTDISYPVRAFDGNVAAALTVPYLHVFDGSLPTTVDQTRRQLEKAAGQISQSLGWQRPPPRD